MGKKVRLTKVLSIILAAGTLCFITIIRPNTNKEKETEREIADKVFSDTYIYEDVWEN